MSSWHAQPSHHLPIHSACIANSSTTRTVAQKRGDVIAASSAFAFGLAWSLPEFFWWAKRNRLPTTNQYIFPRSQRETIWTMTMTMTLIIWYYGHVFLKHLQHSCIISRPWTKQRILIIHPKWNRSRPSFVTATGIVFLVPAATQRFFHP